MVNYIWITTQFEGFHNYENAPECVSFLKNIHRHIFKVKVWIEVNHNDRDIEFFMFKKYVNTIISNNNLNNLSCEMIADCLYEQISNQYSNRKIKISVSEDGENGCEKEY
jgi:6-pyruvoyl-tetrahydropterin synthase